MRKTEKTDQGSVKKIEGLAEAAIRSLQFTPSFNASVLEHKSAFSINQSWFYFDEKAHEAIIQKLLQRYPNIARPTIEKQCDIFFRTYTQEYIIKQRVDWDIHFLLADHIANLVSKDLIYLQTEQLLSNLKGMIRTYDVFVPILGINLNMPAYDFGPIKLVRTLDGLPTDERTRGIAEFKYVH